MESTAAKLVMENLGELVSSDVAGILNVDAEVKSLTETLALIQSFLRDADQKPRYAQSYSLQEWMRQIRNLAFEMEDLVDEYAVQLGRASASDGRMSSLQRLGAFPSRILTRRLLTSRLQDIRARFQYVCKQASQLGFQRTPAVTTPGAKFLRVYLDLQKLLIEHLPKEIGDLILLRYLNLERSKLKELPSSIGNLIYLQTFNIQGTKIQHLPDGFWKIRTLRHVFLTEENTSMPKGLQGFT
ncbi:putative disease resistance protein At1g50180 [Zingiber officinale]|uniref:putative disease resistance protein At1g50180 n=1 Tax=Zingiber officinale TaxID=94328 RepID=UPI001C4B71E4|nr:putative disease resistance protein At1g50180 [Zingiber officinale]